MCKWAHSNLRTNKGGERRGGVVKKGKSIEQKGTILTER